MAVMVKDASAPASMRPELRLALDSFAGALYFLGSLGLVFKAIPYLCELVVAPLFEKGAGAPVFVTFEICVMTVAALGLAALGLKLIGAHPLHGLRAGILVGLLEVLLILHLTSWVGQATQTVWTGETSGLGLLVTIGLAVALLVLGFLAFLRPNVSSAIVGIEDQGWFSIAGYKKSQGQKVRRGTILGILILAGCGIYTLIHHPGLTAGEKDWQVAIPFTDLRIVLLPDVAITLPLVLAMASLWLAYRAVNLPVFADFLIATEAELNKVSWTTRKRLIQDTVVVLVTVALLTVFLFVVDQGWAFVLSRVGVLQVPEAKQQTDSAAGLRW